jgi:uncharacterized membrane protein YqgA involved in biofilm formation
MAQAILISGSAETPAVMETSATGGVLIMSTGLILLELKCI